MTELLFALLALLAGLILLVALLWAFASSRKAVPVPYEAQPLLTAPEQVFYTALCEAAGPGVAVLAKVRLADLIKVRKGQDSSDWAAAFNRIAKKHVDFVLCEPEALGVLGVIELDDRSHERADRQDRDAFVDRALAEAGIAILHIKTAKAYDPTELQGLLFE